MTSAAAGSAWTAALDELEARIDRHARVLTGAPAPAPFHLPPGIGPLPGTLAGRARALLARQRALEAELEAHLGALRAFFFADTPAPRYLDARA